MNANMTTPSWSDVKSKIQTKWTKISDSEIEAFKGSLDGLSDKIQKVYGYAKDRADRELSEFKASLSASSDKQTAKVEDLKKTTETQKH